MPTLAIFQLYSRGVISNGQWQNEQM